MMRQFIPLVLLGTALVPDWATALGGRRYLPCPPPAFVSCPPRLVILPPCLPPYVWPAAPYIAPGPTPGAGPSVEMPLPKLTQDPPAVARPEVARPEAAKPEVVPKAPVPGVPPAPLGPKNESLEAPKETVRTPNPARAIESVPLARPRAVPPEPANPITPVGNLATPAAPEAIRVPAPASPEVKLEGARIPPLVPRIPGGDTTLPPLNIVIPGDAPSTSTSRSSPLSGRKAVEVIPVAGDAPASPRTLRNVGFFNNSERDVTLTVQGETITLPKHTFVTANVPRSFTWKLDAEAERTTEIPPGAPGVEVVIRR